jgi:hypothetical protein
MLFLKNTVIFQKTLRSYKAEKIDLDLMPAFYIPEQYFLLHRTKKRFFWFDYLKIPNPILTKYNSFLTTEKRTRKSLKDGKSGNFLKIFL